MSYSPIERYGVVGNLETCALVGEHGSIDWCCFPHLESPSVFAALLDDEDGGRFSVRPADSFDARQRYVERTNVLETAFSTADGEAVLTDFMPVVSGQSDVDLARPTLVRHVACTEGSVELAVEFDPEFDYARADTVVEPAEYGAVARGDAKQLNLYSDVSIETDGDVGRATDVLDERETSWYLLQYGQPVRTLPDYDELLADTVDYWRSWVRNCSHDSDLEGPWQDLAVRSSLLLKLLIHQPTGAIAAAPTTSLPEAIGGVRNWDYRFGWLRDSALTIRALMRVGCHEEARAFVEWTRNIMYAGDVGDSGRLFYQPLYGLHGETDLEEETLPHLDGYRESSPVRVGNDAHQQRQLDIYGELVLCIYEMFRYRQTITDSLWETVTDVVEYVCDAWTERDNGIWEVRGRLRHFVHSKVMCWVAVDRAIRIATDSEFDAPLERWRSERDAMEKAILERGYDEQRDTFVRAFGSDELDAAALRMPILEFLPPDDPRITGTIDTIREELTTDEGLVYRYTGEDGVPGDENPFVLCSFWLVQSLLLAGREEEAIDVFESVLDYASPLGLFAEEIDPQTGEHRGNFPQAFSHIGLVQCVLYLHAVLDDVPTTSV